MDYSLKWNLLSSLDILSGLPDLVERAIEENDDSDSEFPQTVGLLVDSIGIIAVDALAIEKADIPVGDFANVLEVTLQLAAKAVGSGNPYIGREVCDFLNHFLHR